LAQQFAQAVVDFFASHGISPHLTIFLVSISPFANTGFLAASILQISAPITFVIVTIGNILSMLLLLIFLERILEFGRRFKNSARFINWVDSRTAKKRAKIEKLGPWGLFLFVSIPFIPGGGTWVGSMIAVGLRLVFKRAFAALLAGVLVSNVIAMVISHYALPSLFYY